MSYGWDEMSQTIIISKLAYRDFQITTYPRRRMEDETFVEYVRRNPRLPIQREISS